VYVYRKIEGKQWGTGEDVHDLVSTVRAECNYRGVEKGGAGCWAVGWVKERGRADSPGGATEESPPFDRRGEAGTG